MPRIAPADPAAREERMERRRAEEKREKYVLSPREYCVGIDYGQLRDYTAICVLRLDLEATRAAKAHVYELTHATRIKLGTPFHEIHVGCIDLITALAPRGDFGEWGQVTLSADAGGMGQPLVEELAREYNSRLQKKIYVPRLDFRACQFIISPAPFRRPRRRGEFYGLPRIPTLTRAVIAFQNRTIRISKSLRGKDIDALVEELRTFHRETTLQPSGAGAVEEWREGTHDDLLFSLALALFGWQVRGSTGTRRMRVVR